LLERRIETVGGRGDGLCYENSREHAIVAQNEQLQSHLSLYLLSLLQIQGYETKREYARALVDKVSNS
jgi:hypothetical protein